MMPLFQSYQAQIILQDRQRAQSTPHMLQMPSLGDIDQEHEDHLSEEQTKQALLSMGHSYLPGGKTLLNTLGHILAFLEHWVHSESYAIPKINPILTCWTKGNITNCNLFITYAVVTWKYGLRRFVGQYDPPLVE